MLIDQENPEKSEELESSHEENTTPIPPQETSSQTPEETSETPQLDEEENAISANEESTQAVDASEGEEVSEESVNESAEPSPSEEAPVEESTPVVEAPAPVQEESTPEIVADVEEVASSEETPVQTESPSIQEEKTPAIGEEVSPSPTAESSPEQPEEETPSTETEETAAETTETPAQPAEEPISGPPTPEDLPALNEAIAARVGEILSQKGASTQVLTQASIGDLIHLMDGYLKEGNVLGQAPKVGLAKRSYDTIKYQGDLDKSLEEIFLSRLAQFNQRRVAEQRRMEGEREVNYTKKKDLLAQLKAVVEQEDPLKIQEVRAIQDQWKAIGQVPKAHLDALYTDYRYLLDSFYKLREMHFELLDYDRKINLGEKERLIEEAKASLIPGEDVRDDPEVWKEKMDLLSELQQQWKSVGHVPREDMDRINNEYRSIIDEFFEIREGFKSKLDEARQENADKKVAILAKMEEYREYAADRPKVWNEASKVFRALQEEYKEIGQAPKSVNGELWARYRDVCNAFYGKKAEFFKKFDDFRQENLEKKKALVERAEALAASQEWERGAKELKRLQRDWKETGPVPERHSNKLWNRFRAACDSFFESRRAHYHDLHAEEHENLAKKRTLIDEVKKITEEGSGSVPEMIERIKTIQKEWREIGKVPYKEKDKIWDEFRAEVDAFFNGLPAKRSEIREMKVRTTLDSIDDQDERTKVVKDRVSQLRRKIGKARETITQYQENMDRIARGKSGDALRAQINGQIDKENKLIDEYKKQITEFNEMLKNPPKPAEPAAEEAPASTEADTAAPVAEDAPAEEVTPAEETAPAEETTDSTEENKED